MLSKNGMALILQRRNLGLGSFEFEDGIYSKHQASGQ